MSNTDHNNDHWPDSHKNLQLDELQQLSEKLLPVFKQTLAEQKIPFDTAFADAFKNIYTPLCAWLSSQNKNKPLVLGINGSQGSGKSTLTRILGDLLEQGFNKKVVSFSIDDLYKTKEQRERLATSIHPLFKTRGVPGTHDAELGISIIRKLLDIKTSEVSIPVFDKSLDDRSSEKNWTLVTEPCDIIIIEGWCVGSVAQNKAELAEAVNSLEKSEDPEAIWRIYVNQQLEGIYTELYSHIDILLMLKIPDFNKVFEWRKLQEAKLRSSLLNKIEADNKTMSDSEIDRFIMHYERITRHTLNEMPERCDIVFELGENHHVKNVIARCQP